MKVFVDTNLFIDILLSREDFVEAAAMIYKLSEHRMIEGFIAPITINNIHYICRKSKRNEQIKAFLAEIAMHFSIASLRHETILLANRLKTNDYEDALQYAMAMQEHCEYLVTRNERDFKHLTQLKVCSPELFLQHYEK